MEFLIKFIWINIGETYRDLKGSFSILRIYQDSQFNNTKAKILKYNYKTRLKPSGNLLGFSARPEDVEKTGKSTINIWDIKGFKENSSTT